MTGTWDAGLVSRFDRVRSSRLAVFVTTDRGRLAQTAGRSVLSDDVVGGGQLVESLPTTHPCPLETVSVTEKMNLAEPETHNSVGRTRGIAIFYRKYEARGSAESCYLPQCFMRSRRNPLLRGSATPRGVSFPLFNGIAFWEGNAKRRRTSGLSPCGGADALCSVGSTIRGINSR